MSWRFTWRKESFYPRYFFLRVGDFGVMMLYQRGWIRWVNVTCHCNKFCFVFATHNMNQPLVESLFHCIFASSPLGSPKELPGELHCTQHSTKSHQWFPPCPSVQAPWYLYLFIFRWSWTCYPSLTQSTQDWAVIPAQGKSFCIPVLWVSPSMKWESWSKHTEEFSSKWLLKEQLAFQSHDVFFGKCVALTIIKLDKIKGKLETIPPQTENCRGVWKQLEHGKGNCKAPL